MTNIVFNKGETLTASKLNALVQAVTATPPAAAAEAGSASRVKTMQVKQREFSDYFPLRKPVFIDQASPFWPLAGKQVGWFWRPTADPKLKLIKDPVGCTGEIYFNTTYSPFGEVKDECFTTAPITEIVWDPLTKREGKTQQLAGIVRADRFATGTSSAKLKFFEAPLPPNVQLRAFSAPSSALCTITGIPPEWLAPASGSVYGSISLLGPKKGNAQFFSRLVSDGGMFFNEQLECSCCLVLRDVKLIPRLALLPAPSTDAPISTAPCELLQPLAPGTWHELASVLVGDQKIALNIQWTKPWLAYVNMSTAPGTPPCYVTWGKCWGLPSEAPPPGSLSVNNDTWHVVSRSSPYMQILDAWNFPNPGSWRTLEERILAAEGEGAPITDCCQKVIGYVPVIFQAFVRRQVGPECGWWCVWTDRPRTDLYGDNNPVAAT